MKRKRRKEWHGREELEMVRKKNLRERRQTLKSVLLCG